jgi:transposase
MLPLIPAGATTISQRISVVRQEGMWVYYCGIQPVFQHAEGDRQSFQMFTAQLCSQGACTQAQIIRAFGVSKKSVLRSVAKYRRGSVGSFYGRRRGRGPTVMGPEVIAQVQALIDRGYTLKEAAQELNLQYDTMRKVIRKLRPEVKPTGKNPAVPGVAESEVTASDKSTRSEEDAAAGEQMGVACTRPEERVLAAVGNWPRGPALALPPAGMFPTEESYVPCQPWRITDC